MDDDGGRCADASHRAAGLSARAWLDRGAFSQGLREGLSARAWLDREGLRFAQQPGGTSQVASSQDGGSRGGCRMCSWAEAFSQSAACSQTLISLWEKNVQCFPEDPLKRHDVEGRAR